MLITPEQLEELSVLISKDEFESELYTVFPRSTGDIVSNVKSFLAENEMDDAMRATIQAVLSSYIAK